MCADRLRTRRTDNIENVEAGQDSVQEPSAYVIVLKLASEQVHTKLIVIKTGNYVFSVVT
jgi:hypothetical protein